MEYFDVALGWASPYDYMMRTVTQFSGYAVSFGYVLTSIKQSDLTISMPPELDTIHLGQGENCTQSSPRRVALLTRLPHMKPMKAYKLLALGLVSSCLSITVECFVVPPTVVLSQGLGQAC